MTSLDRFGTTLPNIVILSIQHAHHRVFDVKVALL
jgi:hypothetical protein